MHTEKREEKEVFLRSSVMGYHRVQAHSQVEARKPRPQHKVGNLTLFSPKISSDDIKWAGHRIFYETTCPLSNDSDQPAQMRRLISVIALR